PSATRRRQQRSQRSPSPIPAPILTGWVKALTTHTAPHSHKHATATLNSIIDTGRRTTPHAALRIPVSEHSPKINSAVIKTAATTFSHSIFPLCLTLLCCINRYRRDFPRVLLWSA